MINDPGVRTPLLQEKPIWYLHMRWNIDNGMLPPAPIENTELDRVIDCGEMSNSILPKRIEQQVFASRDAERLGLSTAYCIALGKQMQGAISLPGSLQQAKRCTSVV